MAKYEHPYCYINILIQIEISFLLHIYSVSFLNTKLIFVIFIAFVKFELNIYLEKYRYIFNIFELLL